MLKRSFIGQLSYGEDLYDSLTEIVRREKVILGRIHGIGATTEAVVAYYDQHSKTYQSLEFKSGMEILNLSGNVSIRDGQSFVHAHITLSDAQGNVFGGHLMKGTKIFACEVTIEEFDGEPLERGKDDRTGLFLWKTESSRLR